MIPLLAFASAAWRTRIVLVGIVLVLTVAAALAGRTLSYPTRPAALLVALPVTARAQHLLRCCWSRHRAHADKQAQQAQQRGMAIGLGPSCKRADRQLGPRLYRFTRGPSFVPREKATATPEWREQAQDRLRRSLSAAHPFRSDHRWRRRRRHVAQLILPRVIDDVDHLPSRMRVGQG